MSRGELFDEIQRETSKVVAEMEHEIKDADSTVATEKALVKMLGLLVQVLAAKK